MQNQPTLLFRYLALLHPLCGARQLRAMKKKIVSITVSRAQGEWKAPIALRRDSPHPAKQNREVWVRSGGLRGISRYIPPLSSACYKYVLQAHSAKG